MKWQATPEEQIFDFTKPLIFLRKERFIIFSKILTYLHFISFKISHLETLAVIKSSISFLSE